jgi:D-serine dehydratase
MRDFISASGVKIAPHGKTTMAPALFQMQMEHGAWGITLATAPQCFVAWRHGIHRILMANQLIGRQNMAIISQLLDDREMEFYCLVDSVEQIDLLGTFFSERQQRLQVLLELGMKDGRTGVRTQAGVDACLASLARWQNTLLLCGVEIYEGVTDEEPVVREFLQATLEEIRRLAHLKAFQRSPVILSGAGSAWYDIVAETFSSAALPTPVEIVLRPGCYITHDGGIYRQAQERVLNASSLANSMIPALLPALHVWAYVQSIPQPELAIIFFGKRDASYDSGFPVPILHYRPGSALPRSAPEHWRVHRMMDQHTFLTIKVSDDLRVGDMLAFDISHPCLTFDKWRVLPILDDDYQVVDIVTTYF